MEKALAKNTNKLQYEVFVTKIEEEINISEMWRMFKAQGRILHISIPEKKYGNIFGFVKK